MCGSIAQLVEHRTGIAEVTVAKIGKLTAIIILHFHLQPQFKYELFNISNWICQKVPAEIVKTSKFCCRHKEQKPNSPPLCLSHMHNCESATNCTLWVHSNW